MKSNKRFQLSIPKKLLILNVILFFLVIITVSDAIIRVVKNPNISSAVTSSGDAVYVALNPEFNLNNVNNENYIKSLGEYYNVDIVITDNEGNIKLKSNKITYEKMDLEKIESDILNKSGDEVNTFFRRYRLIDDEVEYNLLVFKETNEKYELWKSILSVLIPIIAVLIIEYLIVKRKLKDLTYICNGIIRMSKGDLNYKLEKKSTDEFGLLVDEINKMSYKLKERIDNEVNIYKFKNNLITNISHDLRTPLTSLIGYIELAGNSAINQGDKEEYIRKALNKAKRIKILISELFQYSKLESGEVRLEKYNINIVEMIEQCIGEYSSLATQNNLRIIKEYKNTEIVSFVDGELMIRAFENILENAIKYSRDSTDIYVYIKDEADNVIISFVNTTEEKIKMNVNRLFERFYRADEARSQEISGSGLGLFITQSIISLHKGKIWIETNENQFKVYIKVLKN